MKLRSVSLQNFRCYRQSTSISIGDLTALIGKNDAGKSTVLEALEIFFNNRSVKIDASDISVGSDSKEIVIGCEFDDLPHSLIIDEAASTSLADEFLLNERGHLEVVKVWDFSTKQPKLSTFARAGHPTEHGVNDLHSLKNVQLKARLRESHIDEAHVHLVSNPSIRQAIWRACPELSIQSVLVPLNAEGGKAIWERLQEHMPLFALFQSERAGTRIRKSKTR
jgi:energy-coupling factor transporter ATP-binding protein EcfA2